MNTAVGDIEADQKALRLRAARQQREARVRFWRVVAVSSFFIVALGANLYVGAVVVVGKFGNPFASAKAANGQTAQIRRPLLDGTFCRNIVFDNSTAKSIEDKVERCDKVPNQPKGRIKTQFSWGGR
ncbi:MAG: hypothetical protein HY848_05000 [Betaproteobacteria bacterium]|nr:hypothetical protein [Betaproteobacteria bacterium]